MNNVNINKKHTIIGIGILLLIISIIASMYIPTTYIVEKAYTEEYLVPVYKTVTHNDPIYADKYKTVTHNDPIYENKYKTITHREPEYKTLYTLTMRYDFYEYYVIQNVFDVEFEYLGIGSGRKLWNAEVFHNDGDYSKYLNIETQSKTNERVEIVGYNTWTEQVLDGQKIVGYNTWTEQVLDGQKITGYNIWTEKVVDKHDTKERIAYKDVSRTCSWFTRITGIVL